MIMEEKTEAGFKTAVIGLGIIGGSMAYGLRDFKGGTVVGCDMNSKVRESAEACGAVERCFSDAGDAIEDADLVVIATYPDSVVQIVKENRARFKSGAVITDICGVKTRISKEITEALPEGTYYVGSHPMAGKEVEGFENAEPDLFCGCGFIIVPSDKSDESAVLLVCEMAEYLGAARIAVSTPAEHDAIIAYTSDLMHVSAAALCLNFNDDMNLAYTAGAFRDCTRIALINPKLWTELFLENADYTVGEIDRYIESLNKFREAIDKRDGKGLYELLSHVRENKINILDR